MQFQSPDIKDAEIAQHTFDAHCTAMNCPFSTHLWEAGVVQTASKRYKDDVSAYCSEDQMQFTTAIFVPGVHYEVHLIAVTHEHCYTVIHCYTWALCAHNCCYTWARNSWDRSTCVNDSETTFYQVNASQQSVSIFSLSSTCFFPHVARVCLVRFPNPLV